MSNDLACAISTNIIKDDDSAAGVGTTFLCSLLGGLLNDDVTVAQGSVVNDCQPLAIGDHIIHPNPKCTMWVT